MCGIVGKINFNNQKINKAEILDMLSIIKHRGPDGSNYYINNNLGLGHTLLKIQDLTANSSQPYTYKNYILIYNGEIYNFQELKQELISEGYKFDSSGDTEVLIKYIYAKGITETLKKIEGCYSIGLYDNKAKKLYLIRDKFGIKPLYYYIDDSKLIFASEIKSILQDKSIKREFNLETIAISFNCKLWMDPEKTLFKNIYMLKPGTILEIDNNYNIKKKKYYELNFKNEYSNPEILIEDFSKEFTESVKKN